jgi:hypothetical protein
MKPIRLFRGNIYGAELQRTLAGATHLKLEVWGSGIQPRAGLSTGMARALQHSGLLLWLPDPRRAHKRRAKR